MGPRFPAGLPGVSVYEFKKQLHALVAVVLLCAVQAAAADLPAGFSEVALVPPGSLASPTAMQFAPDGRLFVADQSGQLRVIKNGVLLPTPFVSLTVDSFFERGLLGVAFDPNFASNQYVYVYYTVPSGPGVAVHNRISRFTASGDVAVPGSEFVLMELDSLGAGNHNGGAINFGPDGKLYAAVGDNAASGNAQSLFTRHGKMLRLNADGSIPADNPFYGVTSGANRAIWAMGLRNPFTFAQNPSGPAPQMLINDVGQSAWEEVNVGFAGANYGWPGSEGYTTAPGISSPRYAYPHGSGVCAVTGGAFYNPAAFTFPSPYLNAYFFADYCAGWIKVIDPAQGSPEPTDFATGISFPVDLKVGADGALYYLARGTGTVYRVQYSNIATPPAITGHPSNTSVAVGAAAAFFASASGSAPLQYQWQRDGVDIGGATGTAYLLPVSTLADSGAQFRVRVSNATGVTVFSNPAVLTVTSPQEPPGIAAHPVSVTVSVGQSASFSVVATGAAPLFFQWTKDGLAIAGATSSTYTFDNAQLADSGARFQVAVSNAAGVRFSNEAVLSVSSVAQPPTITLQPANISVAAGSPATFFVSASGAAPLSYQWARDGVGIPGATASSYTLSVAQQSDNGARFSVAVANGAGVVFSNEAVLAVGSSSTVPPSIAAHPASISVVVGSPATFSVAASGAAPLTYQWVRDGVGIPGANASSYTVPAAQLTDSGARFHVAVANAAGVLFSNTAVLTVSSSGQAPSIVSQPSNVTAAQGAPATFTVVADGTFPLTYQWIRNGVGIPGAASSRYTLPAVQASDNGAFFSVAVINGSGVIFTTPATLTVTPNSAPRATIITPELDAKYSAGTALAFSGTADDPEDGSLGADAFSWRIDFHHDSHVHPFMPTTPGITSGSVDIPSTGHTETNVWYRVILTVTDRAGATTTVTRDIVPRRVLLTIATTPGGGALVLNGQRVSTPLSFESVVGITHTLEAADQDVAGTTYAFHSWADGGAAARTIDAPYADSTYTARLRVVAPTAPPEAPSGLAAVTNGATLHLSWPRAAGATSYRVEAGTATGLADTFDGDIGDVASLQAVVPPGDYFVRVRSVNAIAVSAPSNEVEAIVATRASCVAPPPPPAGYSVQTAGLFASLSWQASPTATGYVIEGGSSSGAADYGATAVGDVVTYQATVPSGTYFTRLRASNACGLSEASREIPVVVGCRPGASGPGNLTITRSSQVATFTWVDPIGVSAHRMLVGSGPGLTDIADIPIGGAPATFVDLTNVPAGIYYVRVAAVTACGISAPSNEVAVSVP